MYPRFLRDDSIYLAFFPRKFANHDQLFSVVDLSNGEIDRSIVSAPGHPAKYKLRDDLVINWASLETALVDVAKHLIDNHPRLPTFPKLSPPRWPSQCGYLHSHDRKERAVSSARRSRDAFRMLSAFLSFALSLWLTEYEDDCFERAFNELATRMRDPIPRVWLQYLENSVVCNLSAGFRPGGFLNPYTTAWGPSLCYFTRARVPIWLLWGFQYTSLSVAHPVIKSDFLPSDKYIKLAQNRSAAFKYIVPPHQPNVTNQTINPASDTLVNMATQPASKDIYDLNGPLPDFATMDNGDEFVSNNNPDEPPPAPAPVDRRSVVDKRSGQLPGEMWEEFSARMEAGLEKCKSIETAQEKQIRESLEKHAREHGRSRDVEVFMWEQDEVDKAFYRRRYLDKSVVADYWDDFTPFQRRFWSHKKQWDLCPQLPSYAPGSGRKEPGPYDEFFDDDDDEEQPPPAVPIRPTDRYLGSVRDATLQIVKEVHAREEGETAEACVIRLPTLVDYLFRCYGFNAAIGEHWSPHLHKRDGRARSYLDRTDRAWVIKHLRYSKANAKDLLPLGAPQFTSVIDFHNTAIAVGPRGTKYHNLPAAWDMPSTLRVDLSRIHLFLVQSGEAGEVRPIYILRPPRGSRHPSPWFIATNCATVVLLVYRSTWVTMVEIARGLLELGIAFYTVEPRPRSMAPHSRWRNRSRGLGRRPRDFTPVEQDYVAYLHARNYLLRTAYGPAIRRHGGIVGRLAAEIVPDIEVLNGPAVCDAIIGYDGDYVYVDDDVSDEMLDIVCGVYHVTEITAVSQQSWWPKHTTWFNLGYSNVQWLPDAEYFYARRLAGFNHHQWSLITATQWRQNHKFDRALCDDLETGVETLAVDFLMNSSRGLNERRY